MPASRTPLSLNRYKKFSVSKVFRVAKRAEFFQRNTRDTKFGDKERISEMADSLVAPVVYPISLAVTKDGRLDFKPDLFAKTLQGADATRLKI
jgi:hypothetical protein